jgi:hypothetical protein
MIKKTNRKAEKALTEFFQPERDMKRQPAEYARTFFLMWAILATLPGCAILFGSENDITKSADVHYQSPPEPYTQIAVSSADRVWQSTHTGNTIAFNSGCGGDNVTRKAQDFLSGVNELKTKNDRTITIDGVQGEHVRAVGQTQGVPIEVVVITYQKGNCIYDLTYVARQSKFEEELPLFDRFAEKFHAE